MINTYKLTNPKSPPYTKNLGPDTAKYLEVYNDAKSPANEKMLYHVIVKIFAIYGVPSLNFGR